MTSKSIFDRKFDFQTGPDGIFQTDVYFQTGPDFSARLDFWTGPDQTGSFQIKSSQIRTAENSPETIKINEKIKSNEHS